MIRIEVTKELRTIPFTDKKTGQRTSFDVQVCYAHIGGEKYPSKCEIAAPKGAAPYQPGMYTLAPESIYLGEYNRLSLSPVLVPLAAAKVG